MNDKALRKLSYGMYVVTSGREAKCNGQIANAVMQVSSDPPTLAVCINKQNFTHGFIRESRVFAVSVLSKETPLSFIGVFGFKCGRDADKFEGTNYKTGKTGTRVILDNAVAYLEAEVMDEVDVGTHTVFIGKVVDAEVLSDAEPMTYAFYHQTKKGAAPPTAPTYSKPEKTEKQGEEDKTMAKYKCVVCGYIYDPEQGDPDSGIAAGTPFEALPANWVCPVCGVAKDQFEKLE